MTQLERMKLRIPDENNENILEDFLASAETAILLRRYPFGDGAETLEARYMDLQIRLAVEMYNKMGAEGESAHSENGVSRTYSEYDTLLREVVPKGAVI